MENMVGEKFIFAWGGEQALFDHYVEMPRHISYRHIPGCDVDELLISGQGSHRNWYHSQSSVEKLRKSGEQFFDKSFRDKFLLDLCAAVADYRKKEVEISNKLAHASEMDNAELGQLFQTYVDELVKIWAYFASSQEEIMHAVETRLLNKLEEKYGNNFMQLALPLLTPSEEDVLLREKIDFLQVAKNPSRENLLNHAKKYHFLMFCVFSREKALELLQNRLNSTSVEQLQSEIKLKQTTLQQLAEKQQVLSGEVDVETAALASFVRSQAHWRLELKSCWSGSQYCFLPLFEEISKRSGVGLYELVFLATPVDILGFLLEGKKISSEELERRKQAHLLYFKDLKITLYSGAVAVAKRKELLDPSLPLESTREFHGTIANTGKVVGLVRVVKVDNPDSIAKLAQELKPGSILVTGMTNPTMVPLFKKLAGIITDEGGMACHAAIISRELGVPCLVGCKIAMQVLKDGDEVEVDATSGIVRKL